MDFDIVQILTLATVDIQGNPFIVHVGHYSSPTVTYFAKMIKLFLYPQQLIIDTLNCAYL
jgi:hypothetical protein